MKTEKELHFIWQYGLFNVLNVQTTAQENIQIKSFGQYNEKDAGPDFFNAKIIIGDRLWVGNVEIHKKTSDWYDHLHHFDEAYNNVILHVVWENNLEPIKWVKNIPVLELKKYVSSNLKEGFKQLMEAKSKLPCAKLFKPVEPIVWLKFKEQLLLERFFRKGKEIKHSYLSANKDWEETAYRLLLRSMGAKLNKEAFQILARSLPISIIKKHVGNIIQLEALLFGCAGMLEEEFKDLYPNKLKEEFSFLSRKYKLEPMEKYIWKWLRLRPNAFPSIQLAMLAQLLNSFASIDSLFTENKSWLKFNKGISVGLNDYWENHYRFDQPSKNKKKSLGAQSALRIYINAVIPYQFAKLENKGDDKAFDIVDYLFEGPVEKNSIINKYLLLGFKNEDSSDSQALLELFEHYCTEKKCLNCSIGLNLLKRESINSVH